MLHEQREQQLARTAVAVEERVDGLEQSMCLSNPNQGRKTAVVMQSLLQGSNRAGDLHGRRRDEAGFSGSAAANPVLGAADFTGLLVLAADATHQDVVGLAQEADAQRQAHRVCKLSPGVEEGVHIDADFSDIVRTVRPIRALESEDAAQRGLLPFDPRSYDHPLPNEAVEKPIRARHH